MTPTRRDAVKLARLAGFGTGLPRGIFAAEDIPELAAQVARLPSLPERDPQTEIRGDGGTIPGREIRVGQGECVRRRFVDDTVFPHTMHLRGMRFRKLSVDGALGPLRDTVLVGGRETREIAFTADDPGDRLFHGHMLGDAASGMTTWGRVT